MAHCDRPRVTHLRRASAERERLLHPGVLIYSAICSGLAATMGGLLAFGAAMALYSPLGAPKAPPGSGWHVLGLLFASLAPGGSCGGGCDVCSCLIPIHRLLVRLRLRSHVFYQVAMLAIVLASYYVFTGGQEWSLAFTMPVRSGSWSAGVPPLCLCRPSRSARRGPRR